MNKTIVNGLFGLFFNGAAIAFVIGIFLLVGALIGEVEGVWLIRAGIILEITGITLFALEYIGVAQYGQSPLRWWLRRLMHPDSNDPAPALWPRQMVLVLGVISLVTGLLLQLFSSWS